MSQANKLFNSIFVFVIFLVSCTRGALARIWPASSPPKPPTEKVFALTEAEWQELRAGAVAVQENGESKKGEEKKESPPPKTDEEKKEPPKCADSDQSRSEGGEDKSTAPKSGEGEQGPGGGDGDMGGSGG
jgi:hypothetical protein